LWATSGERGEIGRGGGVENCGRVISDFKRGELRASYLRGDGCLRTVGDGQMEEAMDEIVADENTEGDWVMAGEVKEVLRAERVGFEDRLHAILNYILMYRRMIDYSREMVEGKIVSTWR
jgi:hypothetical protein